MPYNTEEIKHAYNSKYNKERKNQVILLMITNGKKSHYLAVKKLSALFIGIASKHKGDFYCLNYFHSYRTENNNPEKTSTVKINKHAPSGYLLFTHCSFDLSKNKLDCYRGKDCMERFCKDLKKHATKIINMKKMVPLTDK